LYALGLRLGGGLREAANHQSSFRASPNTELRLGALTLVRTYVRVIRRADAKAAKSAEGAAPAGVGGA
jgi:hypothetical protein